MATLSVRKKIWLGTGFLFILLVVTGGVSIYQILKLKNESRAILLDNYETLEYCHAMQQYLDSLQEAPQKSLILFEKKLSLQESNITEAGELVLTKLLRSVYNNMSAGDTTWQTITAARRTLQAIIALNMQAIQNKNDRAEKTAESTLLIIEVLVGAVFLVAFTFLLNFPSIIADPINKLQEAIQQISNKNYKHRIHIRRQDEFGNVASAFNEMAERLEYFESSNLNKLMFEKSRAEAVINSLKDASIGIDKNNQVLFANFQALELLGTKASEIVGKSVEDVSKKNDLFSFLISHESNAPFKVVVEGRENYFTRELMEVEQGDAKSRVIILNNITSFKELDVAKTNFIATISHELKTPLAASDFSLRLLEDERVSTLSNDQKELIAHLKQDNQRMLKILSELLNMSQVETGRIQLHVENVSPVGIIDNAVQTVATSAREKGVTIQTSIANDISKIQADAEKTTWILNNFLSNAIKYSSEGGVIKVAAVETKDSIIFSVSDNGPGIAAEYQARLFERYFQVPGSREKGTGLGLAISKEFIEAEGGRIWVESEIGKGATFSISLPK